MNAWREHCLCFAALQRVLRGADERIELWTLDCDY